MAPEPQGVGYGPRCSKCSQKASSLCPCPHLVARTGLDLVRNSWQPCSPAHLATQTNHASPLGRTWQRAKTEPLAQACGLTSQSLVSPHRLHVKRSCGHGEQWGSQTESL